MTRVVNLRREKFDVYIGRGGKGQDGYFGNPIRLEDESQRVSVLHQYERYFFDRLVRDPIFNERVYSLKGKTLGCFCKPKLCHGDIIVDYLENETRMFITARRSFTTGVMS